MSSFNFDYTIDQAKDCINETESQLRDLIATVCSTAFGLDWENSQAVWDQTTRQKLEAVRSEEKKRFPNQMLSDRLIDYSDILHLKILIQKNWQCFNHIFASKEKTMLQFDILQIIRNPLMHSRPEVLTHQKHLCLGICGEFLLAIENWRQGYIHQIKEYTVLFQFATYPDGENENDAQLHAKHLANEWLSKIVSCISGRLEEKSTSESEKRYLLKIREGHIKVTVKWDYRGYDGNCYFRAADITLTTESFPALEKVLEVSKYPYWYLSWILKEDLDVSIIVSRIKEQTGKRPANAVSFGTQSGGLVYQNVSFRIDEFDASSVRLGLFRAQQNSEAQVCLNFDNPLGIGFYKAHKLFSVEKILAILYGELTHAKVHQLLKEATVI